MILIEGLNKKFNELQVLEDINLSVDEGVIYGLVGESGQGKSTLLRCVNGLIPYDGGSLKVDGVEVRLKKGRELREFRKNIGMIFQNFSLLERANVYDNIAYPMKIWNYKDSEIKKQVKSILEVVHLTDKEKSFPRELSGGQKQRVAIARALVMNPKYLLSDEATSALDPKTSQSILSLLKEINRELGITILLVTHQMEVVRQVCDRMALLKHGKIAIDGDVKEIFLSQSDSLQGLIGGEQETISKNKLGLRICIENDQYKTFFQDIYQQAGINCNLLEGGIEKYKSGNSFIGTIEVENKDIDIAKKFMEIKKIKYEVIIK